ncbi:MAG: adenylate/guanylate cyclase domain-containing protein [Actinomycetota bacterium]|nr:adenylate/guanylate cyclase domain-containing protein [Actinomycetota bacterium]
MTELVEEWIAAGIYDPAADNAGERLELLHWIAAHDVPTERMVQACAEGQLNSLVGDLSLRPGRRLTIAEVAEASGLSLEQMVELRRSGGFPDVTADVPLYVEADLVMFRTFKAANAFFSTDELVHFNRVIGTSLRRIAEAASEMFLRDVEAPMLHESSELDKAKANLAGIELAHSATGLFDPMFRLHLELSTQMNRQARAGTHDYATVPLTIAFVDLNGFTARSGELSPGELLQLVMAFESTATDLISEHGGRMIKQIGDEVMFTTVEPIAACAIARSLIDRAGEWASNARGGIAHGQVLASGGDVYGEIVNLASRIAEIAVPGELLVNESVASSARALAFEPAGRRVLKGFPQPIRLWSMQVV